MRTHFNSLTIIEEEGLVQLVLNRPDKRNAITHEMMAEIDTALDEAELDAEVKAVIVRGEGPMFSAGHDLKEHAAKPFNLQTFPNASPSIPPSLPRAWYFRKPLIGAVHGYVGPYAFALASCCDWTIAATGTRFSCEVFRGTYPDIPWLALYIQLPMRVIEKLWLVGGWMDAEQALQFQLVQRVVPEDEVLPEALKWAAHAATVPTDAFGRGKDKIRRSYELLGINALFSVLDKHPSANQDQRGAEFAANLQDKGVQETMRERRAAVDPTITKV